MNDTVLNALNRLRAARGKPTDWLARNNALSRHIAHLPSDQRVLAVGEYRNETFHTPAAIVHHGTVITGKTLVHFVRPDMSIGTRPRLGRFFSTVTHESIAREVFGSTDDTRTSRS